MWISARTATTLAAAALLLVMVAVAAPLLPKPQFPSLPEERAPKFGSATVAMESPDRTRAQRMSPSDVVPKGAARWAGVVGAGPTATPTPGTVRRLVGLLDDARTIPDRRAEAARPAWVVRLVRDEHRIDVMVDPDHDRLVVVRDGTPIGAYATAGLHREFAALGRTLFP